MPTKTHGQAAADEQARGPVSTTRVDPPHVLGEPRDEAIAEQAVPANPTPAEALALVEQVRSQAAQLAAHLRRQQAALDHRESELNSRLAAVETQVRGARLWLTQRQDELGQIKTAADAREQGLQERAAAIDEAEQAAEKLRRQADAELARREGQLEELESAARSRLQKIEAQESHRHGTTESHLAELNRRQLLLDQREQELAAKERTCDQRQADLDEQRKRVSNDKSAQKESQRLRIDVELLSGELAALQGRLAEQRALNEQAREQLETRRINLEAAENLLARQQSECEHQRQQLDFERDRQREEAHAELDKLANERRRAEAELEKKKTTLKRRGDDLDARRSALKQLRLEVTRTQRETLEMRLATEELWARLCGSMAPAALTQSLGQIRLKLADQNRLAQAELAEQKADLQALNSRLAEQHEKLSAQKHEVQDWLKRRQEEIEQQAAMLVSREQELDRQESQFKQLDQQWQKERLALQQEIRGLLRQVRRGESLAA